MILRFSALVRRRGHGIMLAALIVAAGVVAVAVRASSEPDAVLIGFAAAAGLALLAGAVVGTVVRWQAKPRFEVDETTQTFRTPRSAAPVFLVLFLISSIAFFAVAGGWSWAHGDRDGGWLTLMLLLGGPALVLGAAVRRGHGIILTPDVLHADRGYGTVTIPWAAVASAQPLPDGYVDLVLEKPGLVTGGARLRRRNRLFFEGTPPAFVAAAVRHYAAHPADRPSIGTPAGHRRLTELLDAPTEPPGPRPSRRRVAAVAVTGVLIFGAGVAVQMRDRDGVLGVVAHALGWMLNMLGFSLVVDAVRTRRRPPPTPEPTPEPPVVPHPHRPSWARDVTHHGEDPR